MKIEEMNEGRLVVALSREDMRDLSVTYEELDYAKIETRRAIRTVLDRARQMPGKPMSADGRLLIEVMPDKNGGCTMYFTVIPRQNGAENEKPTMRQRCAPLIFCADGCDALIDAYKKLKAERDKTARVLSCRFCKKNYLIIYPKPMQAAYLSCLLNEYGKVFRQSRAAALKLREYGEEPKEIIL